MLLIVFNDLPRTSEASNPYSFVLRVLVSIEAVDISKLLKDHQTVSSTHHHSWHLLFPNTGKPAKTNQSLKPLISASLVACSKTGGRFTSLLQSIVFAPPVELVAVCWTTLAALAASEAAFVASATWSKAVCRILGSIMPGVAMVLCPQIQPAELHCQTSKPNTMPNLYPCKLL